MFCCNIFTLYLRQLFYEVNVLVVVHINMLSVDVNCDVYVALFTVVYHWLHIVPDTKGEGATFSWLASGPIALIILELYTNHDA